MDPKGNTSQYYIEHRLLLEFLIIRYSEMLGTEELNLDPVMAGLGLVALHQDRELEMAFQTLISSDSYTFQEILTSSIDLFLAELNRLKSADAADYLAKEIERRPMSSGTARKLLSWSWREGRKMLRETDFRFYTIWELVSWLGLDSNKDREYIENFDSTCRLAKFSSETSLECGLEIVKSAIFHRKIDQASLRDITQHQLIRRNDMSSENTNNSGPSVERQTLLAYCLDQVDESVRRRFRLGLSLQILGYSALHPYKDLLQQYEEIHLPCYSPFDRLRGYQRLFAEALARLEDTPIDEVEYTSTSDAKPVIEGLSKESIATARRDGLEMLENSDFRFVSVFLVVSWIGLCHDKDALADFETRCISTELEPGDQVRIGLEILNGVSEPNQRED